MLASNQARESFPISKLGSECRRTNFGAVEAMPRNQGRDLMPQNQCGRPEKVTLSGFQGILEIRDSRFSKIGSTALPQIGKGASRHALLFFQFPQPNKAPEPTPPLVTIRADARLAPIGVVAHL